MTDERERFYSQTGGGFSEGCIGKISGSPVPFQWQFFHRRCCFLVEFGYRGRLERTKMLSNPKLLAELEDHITKINRRVPKYFITVFEVKSIERTGFTNEIKYFKEIAADFFR